MIERHLGVDYLTMDRSPSHGQIHGNVTPLKVELEGCGIWQVL